LLSGWVISRTLTFGWPGFFFQILPRIGQPYNLTKLLSLKSTLNV
jgi:hypothetical protein